MPDLQYQLQDLQWQEKETRFYFFSAEYAQFVRKLYPQKCIQQREKQNEYEAVARQKLQTFETENRLELVQYFVQWTEFRLFGFKMAQLSS